MNKFNYNYFYHMYFMKQISKGMRLLFSVLVIFSSAVALFSCGGSDNTSTITGDWLEFSDFKGVGRGGAIVFQIGDVPYIGLGANLLGSNQNFLGDIYKYEGGNWDLIEPFPGDPRSAAVAFVVNGKAYVGLGIGLDKEPGHEGLNKYFSDFYEYDPAGPVGNKWTAITDFPGGARMAAIAFGIGDYGYVGSGYNGNALQDFWAYDPAQNTWTAKHDIDLKRTNAFAFVYGSKGYIGGGSNNGLLVQSFFMYDPGSDTWTRKNDLQDDKDDADTNDKGYTIARELAASFIIGDYVYVVGGVRNNALNKETWQYDPANDTWKKMTPFAGSLRVGAVGYTIGSLGYVATGHSGGSYFDDIYPFDPSVASN
jgi:N-acetylneuraminic acid mutarotase